MKKNETITANVVPDGWRLMTRREVISGGQHVQFARDGRLAWERYVRPRELYRYIAAAERGAPIVGLVPVVPVEDEGSTAAPGTGESTEGGG